MREYFRSLAPGVHPSTAEAMLFVIEHFAKRGIMIGGGGRALGDPEEFLEQHRQLAILVVMLGQEMGLPSLLDDLSSSPSSADDGALDGDSN